MEQNVGTNAPMTPVMNNDSQNGSNGLKIATVVSCVLAICGVGFGIFGMVHGLQKDNQISDLKVQIKEDDGTVTTVDSPEIETTANEGTTITIIDSVKVSGGPYIENGYFYVPKWGVKFKLSDNLTNYGYAVDQNNQGDSYGDYVVGLTAISKNDYVEHPQATYYNDVFSCSVITIRAMEESKKGWWGNTSADVQFNGFDFVIHDAWRTQNCTSEFMAPTDTVAEQLKTILSNPEKI